MPSVVYRFCLNLLLASVAMCLSLHMAAAQTAAPGPGNEIRSLLAGRAHPWLRNRDLSNEQPVLETLYGARDFAPLWFKQTQPSIQALRLLDVLRGAAGYGLRADDYDGITLTNHLVQLAGAGSTSQAAQDRELLDVGLSAAALRLLQHLHYGRIDPVKAGFDFKVARGQEFDPVTALTELANSNDVSRSIARFEPRFAHYQLLKAALARYRLLAVDAELTQLPGFAARSIKPGETYAGAAALRRLLVAEQDLRAAEAAPDTDTTLDTALVTALRAYQTRHGLPPDGALGKQTFAALTTPFGKRVQQIELTLERWRWLPPLQSPMIVVNIPQFRLFAFNADDDSEVNLLRMDVIVGQSFPHTQTPVFLGDMKYLVFRPYWDVPYNITQREILPAIRRNPDYLQRNHFELVSGQGDNSPVVAATPDNIAQLTTGKVRVRQLPGADNALGAVKFILPNNHNVYLHSTPATQLFAQSRRAFSHGCIRVSDPVALAEYVLRYASGDWSREQIETAMQDEPNQRVNLKTSIPVLIVYGTVMPTESGVVQFFDDIYGYDARLAKLL
jgi:L,D-transpeptidase YcbB